MLNQDEYYSKLSFHLFNSIKVLTSLYKFKEEISDRTKKNKNNEGQKLIIIDKMWFSKYKKFYLWDELFQLIKKYNISKFDISEQKILFNNLFNKFKHNNEQHDNKCIIFTEDTKQFPNIINEIKRPIIRYIDNYEIINKDIYLNLKKSMGDFNNVLEQKDKYYDYIISNNKIIIKYNNNKESIFNLLIGYLDNRNNNYIPEMLVSFKDENMLEKEFNEIFNKNSNINWANYISSLEKIDYNSVIDNNYKNIQDIIFFSKGYNDYDTKLNTNQYLNNNNIKNNKKIIIFFIKLFYEYKKINDFINNNKIQKCNLRLINKKWIDIYKNYYFYSDIEYEIKNNKKLKSFLLEHNNYESIISDEKSLNNLIQSFDQQLISKINNLDKNDLYDNISNISLFSLNYDYCSSAKSIHNEYLKIYNNFEIWTEETYKFFLKLGFPNNYIHSKFSCFLGEKHLIFIENDSKNNLIHVYINGSSDNPNFIPIYLIKPKNISDSINKMNSGFLEYINSKDNSNNKFIKINNSQDILYLLKNDRNTKIKNAKTKTSELLIDILVFNDNLRQTCQNDKYEEKELCLINDLLFHDYLKLYDLKKFYYNIKKDIIDKYNKLPKEKKIGLKKYIKNNIKEEPKEEQIFNQSLSIRKSDDYSIIGKNKEKIYYHNNCLLMDEEKNDNLFGGILKCKIKCLIGYKHVIIFIENKNKSIIEIGRLNKENYMFNIEVLINLYRGFNQEIKRIKELKYSEFNSLINVSNSEGSYAFPYYNKDNKVIGYVYKINPTIKDYSDYCYNEDFRKVLHLIFYFEKFTSQIANKESNIDNKEKKIKFHKYYLINDTYLNSFKENYNYELAKEKLYKIELGKQTLICVKNNNEKMLEKKIIYIIEKIPDMNKFYNANKNVYYNKNIQSQISEPTLNWFNNYYYGKNFKFYIDFYLLEKEIYDIIFGLDVTTSNNMQFSNNYLECFFQEGYTIIKLKKEITQLNEFVLEVGTLNSENKFILYYFLFYNTEADFLEHFNWLTQIGLKRYFTSLDLKNNLYVNLENYDKKKIGEIRLYKQDIDNLDRTSINSDFHIKSPLNIQDSYTPIKRKFLDPPKIGLQNVGATCYMNATLQCLCQVEKLVDHFKSYKRIDEVIQDYKKKNENCLTFSFKYLIENLWPTDKSYFNKKYNNKNSNNKYFVPVKFKEKISKMNPLFEGVKANDSKDLVNFIIMRLHEELNEGTKSENYLSPSQENELAMFTFFQKNYFQENKSIISDLFYGINGTMYECTSCHVKKYNYQVGFFYIFPLEEIRKFKIQYLQNIYMQNMRQQMQFQMMQMGQNMFGFNMNNLMMMNQPYITNLQNSNSVNIFDCFDYNQKIDTMAGENSMHCNICKRQEAAYYHSYIVSSPEIIIIILNRGKGIEFNVKLEFEEYLNLQKYVRNNNNKSCNYQLIGVVTHLGESGASGHFIAYCKSPIDNNWYLYNDDLCFPVTDLKKQVIDSGMPYILFYQRQ